MERHLFGPPRNTSARWTLSGGLHFPQNSKHFGQQYFGLLEATAAAAMVGWRSLERGPVAA